MCWRKVATAPVAVWQAVSVAGMSRREAAAAMVFRAPTKPLTAASDCSSQVCIDMVGATGAMAASYGDADRLVDQWWYADADSAPMSTRTAQLAMVNRCSR